MQHNFLLLCALFALPGALVFLLRPDLRRVMAATVPASLPFALTESLFYPSYWRPKFLFDLADRFGFGIEDLLFVAGLGALASTAYPFVARRRLEPLSSQGSSVRSIGRRLVGFGATTLLAGAVLHLLGVRMIYGACWIMVGVTCTILVRRPDLLVPSLLGALTTCSVYAALCLVLGAVLPGVFRLAWNTRQFSNVFVLGIPLEELLYGASAGFAGTALYPYAFAMRFSATAPAGPVPLAESGSPP
jgi:hypothetical protein